MRIVILGLAAGAAATLAGCASGGLLNRDRPDEFAVTRNAPLVVPPDFALSPPQPGQPAAVGVDSRAQAIEALFGGPAPRSAGEAELLRETGATPTAGARSVAGDPETNVVDKGATTRTILEVPEGDGQEARVQTPQPQ